MRRDPSPWRKGIEMLVSARCPAAVWICDNDSVVPCATTPPDSCHRAYIYENAVGGALTDKALAAPWGDEALQPLELSTQDAEEMAALETGMGGALFSPVEILAPAHVLGLGLRPESGSAAAVTIESLVAEMHPDVDHTVPPVSHTRGGSAQGYSRWKKWLTAGGLKSYAKRRNDALDPGGVSRMSAYLNLGMVSPMRLARELRQAGAARGSKSGAAKYAKEFLTWRGISYAYCYHHHPKDQAEASLDMLPAWARQTLLKHAHDPREKLVSLERLRAARSGDAVWDALQARLVETGEMHNNARMGWGKAVLRWSPDPAQALAALLDLNHRYALDGHAPPSYGGVLGCLGLFESPRGERPVSGQVGMRALKPRYAALRPRASAAV